jgi:hypothetical protein
MRGAQIIQDCVGFNCSRKMEDGQRETWYDNIKNFTLHSNYLEFQIISRFSINVICGKGERGYWACIPDYMAGCDLSMSLNDTF